MQEAIKKLTKKIKNEVINANSLEALTLINDKYLSKKGEFSKIMRNMKDVEPKMRPIIGSLANTSKEEINKLMNEKKEKFEAEKLKQNLKKEKIDIFLPATKYERGSIHPLNLIINETVSFFTKRGYRLANGPEVELDHYNFEMMNLSQDHPARDMQDSFYVNPTALLRTHTSPVQAREMIKNAGEALKIICPGKTYRRDDDDQTHSHQFMQIEGLVVGKNISFANLKYTLNEFLKFIFGEDKQMIMRPSYFPFTEPSVEVDVIFTKKDGTKKNIEILGAGLVHPNVLKMAGYDPNEFSGFAFGVGVERIAMIKYEINDIRNFYTNDLNFLKQFKEELK